VSSPITKERLGQRKHPKENSYANESKTKPGNHANLQKNLAAEVALGFLDATCRLGVAEWNGRETIRQNLRAFIDTGFTALMAMEGKKKK
jgi:hypothetical protein